MTTDATAARPGRSYYAGEVRISHLGTLARSGEEGTELDTVRGDILNVEVTRVHTGASHYSITLNNWFDALPAERTAETPWPPFKYNDFGAFVFGTRLRIDMRYWPDQPQGLEASDLAAHRWVPMISGPITDMKFTFSSGEGSRLTLTGEDDLYPLKNKTRDKVTYRRKSEKEIIEDVLSRASYPLPLSAPAVAWPEFFTDSANGLSETLQEGQSYLDLLQKIAKRFDCELFLEFEDLADPASALGFHLEPARSRVPPDTTLRDIYVLERGQNLIDFAPTFKVFDQFTSVTVKGRHRVRSRPRRVEEEEVPAVLADELHIDAARGDDDLVSGPEIRQRYFGTTFGDNPHQMPNQSNLDESRAREMARAALRGKAREFLTITATTVGLPHLRPGRYAEIRGMRPPFDGFYYVTKSVFRYGSGGFTTQITARRPGMPLPPYSEE